MAPYRKAAAAHDVGLDDVAGLVMLDRGIKHGLVTKDATSIALEVFAMTKALSLLPSQISGGKIPRVAIRVHQARSETPTFEIRRYDQWPEIIENPYTGERAVVEGRYLVIWEPGPLRESSPTAPIIEFEVSAISLAVLDYAAKLGERQ